MKVGDIVQHFLTEQIGIVMAMDDDAIGARAVDYTGRFSFWSWRKEWCFRE